MKSAQELFFEILEANRRGGGQGVYSVCSAHADVLKACMKQALEDGSILLIESTSNQVNQYGGYTGMLPVDFVDFVHSMAAEVGFSLEKLLLGGDHLGPNPWKELPASAAMEEAKVLIKEYIKAGYQKIHLDTSMFCLDDEGDRSRPLSDEIVAERSAILCRVAEDTWAEYGKGESKPFYIIGTEVPVPGGGLAVETEVLPTSPVAAEQTVAITRAQFDRHELSSVWDRVVGLVVQPGVEFSDDQIDEYESGRARSLSRKIESMEGLVYECHSTDYQTEESLKALVRDHFCILKVGPWLTFAYREALFCLEGMERELFGMWDTDLSKLGEVLEEAMLNNPQYWEGYYEGDEESRLFKRKYSFSDRIRYYWGDMKVQRAKERLFKNLGSIPIPLSLISQYMPAQFYAICRGELGLTPEELVESHIRTIAGIYSRSCGLAKK